MKDFRLHCAKCKKFFGWLTDTNVYPGYYVCSKCYKQSKKDSEIS